MNGWLKNLAGFILFGSVTMQMLPNQKYEQYVKLFTGFLMIIIVLQPILKIRSSDIYLEDKIRNFIQEQSDLEQKIGREGMVFQEETLKISEDTTELVEIPEITKVEVLAVD